MGEPPMPLLIRIALQPAIAFIAIAGGFVFQHTKNESHCGA
jgi:hypothetical protein